MKTSHQKQALPVKSKRGKEGERELPQMFRFPNKKSEFGSDKILRGKKKLSAKTSTAQSRKVFGRKHSCSASLDVPGDISHAITPGLADQLGDATVPTRHLLHPHQRDLTVFLLVTAAARPACHQQLCVLKTRFSSTRLPW